MADGQSADVFSVMNVKQLQQELRNRGLKTSGKKGVLIERLRVTPPVIESQ